MYQFTYTNTTRRGDMNFLTRTLVIVITVFMVLTLPTIESNSSGIHNRAGSGCTCHYSGSTPTLSENFPTTYTAGQTYNIQISVSGGVSGNNGGFNVVVDKGTLSIPGVGIMSVKIDSAGQSATHTTNSYRSWSFDWTAPSTGSGSTNVDIAVMSANGNNGNSGDAWTTSSITIPEAGPSNTAPTASNVYISDMPGSPTAITQAYYDTDLFANYDFNDADGDAESGTQIRWLRGGVEVAQHNDINLLNQGATSIGDIWTLTITPSDGTDLGAKVTSSNSVEIIDYDADGDGYGDQSDAFPNDSNEWADSDSDGVGDNADAFDDDNTQTTDSDGVGDNADAFPNDASETADSDLDGVGDNADAFPNDASETMDSDGDNVGDNADAFPNDPTETTDTDGDMVGDNADVFPNDATETSDADEDMIGDNADTDDDNDGLLDTEEATIGTDPFDEDTDGDEVNDKDDALPLDASETMDTDGDGTGDNADTDDDGDGLFDLDELSKGTDRLDPDSDDDGVLDGADVFPMDATETIDSDNDGVGDNADAFPNDPLETVDTDADGVGDNADAFPEDASETMDSDGDGMGDNEQKELEDEAAARMQLMIIIGVVLVLAIVGGLLFMRRKNGDSMESKETTPLPQADPIQPAQEMYATTPEPVQPMVAEPTVENQWTDENGHTWRRMSDGSTLWWNGTDWQQV